jgi:hypothetical protein
VRTIAFLFALAAALWLVSLSMDPTPGPDAAAPPPVRYEPATPRNVGLGGYDCGNGARCSNTTTWTASTLGGAATGTPVCSAITNGTLCTITFGGGGGGSGTVTRIIESEENR